MAPEGGLRRRDGEGELSVWTKADLQDYICQILTGLSDLHRQHATQRRELKVCQFS